MNFSELEQLSESKVLHFFANRPVTDLVIDSRKAPIIEGVVFFAIRGKRHDGHAYIDELYSRGIRQFIVEEALPSLSRPDVNLIQVPNAVHALQQVAAMHRRQYNLPVLAITGSNGKTIIKEWLSQLLSRDFALVKNPGSYNSQVGVPLAVWGIQPYHTFGIFEAGVSTGNEMDKLEAVIQPTLGLFTNVGTAHDEGFNNQTEKITEKLKLFKAVDKLIYCHDHQDVAAVIAQLQLPAYSWGFDPGADIHVEETVDAYNITTLGKRYALRLPFTDRASIENCLHCVAVMLFLKYSIEEIQLRIEGLRAIAMRLELKEGINQCQLIDDSYNNDLQGLQISLDFLTHQHQQTRKRVILSDIFQSGLPEEELVKAVAILINRSGVDAFVGIGPILEKYKSYFTIPAAFYTSTDAFISAHPFDRYREEMILIKGARSFQFEKIVHRLQHKVHGTTMEIDLGALVHNLNFFRSRLPTGTRIMAMVKALAYGSGSIEVANVLQYHQVDYLGVAYPDEGIELRRHHIEVPIMVMNASEESFDQLLEYRLEPEVYSFKMLEALIKFLNGRTCKVHVKIDTGMHRLGFEPADLSALGALLVNHRNVSVASIFSHLAGADESRHDEFSLQQAQEFIAASNAISEMLGYTPLRHILNSPGILRMPDWYLDMVRVGIGLYGISPIDNQIGLRPVATLKTIVSQLRRVKQGDTISYGRWGRAETDRTIATLAIGYADGFSRAFGRGVGKVLINGRMAPVIGNVCMDMTMVDVTGLTVSEGDEVIVFGEDLPIEELAALINTIPYEILTNTGTRVKRIFVAESI